MATQTTAPVPLPVYDTFASAQRGARFQFAGPIPAVTTGAAVTYAYKMRGKNNLSVAVTWLATGQEPDVNALQYGGGNLPITHVSVAYEAPIG